MKKLEVGNYWKVSIEKHEEKQGYVCFGVTDAQLSQKMLDEPGIPHFNDSASACTTNFFYNAFGDEKIRG